MHHQPTTIHLASRVAFSFRPPRLSLSLSLALNCAYVRIPANWRTIPTHADANNKPQCNTLTTMEYRNDNVDVVQVLGMSVGLAFIVGPMTGAIVAGTYNNAAAISCVSIRVLI